MYTYTMCLKLSQLSGSVKSLARCSCSWNAASVSELLMGKPLSLEPFVALCLSLCSLLVCVVNNYSVSLELVG